MSNPHAGACPDNRFRRLICTFFFFTFISACSFNAAVAFEAVWSTTGENEDIAAIDCTDCEELLGLIIACTGNGQPAKITFNGAATENGNDGELLPITITVDDQTFSSVAETVEFGMIGFTPVLQVAYDDPLIPALQAGKLAVVHFNGGRSEYGLKGSRIALDTFKTHCGWTEQGFRQNLERLKQTAPADEAAATQPRAAATDGTAVYGVQPGEVHTPPNEDGVLWFNSAYRSVEGTSRGLYYGIPETDAMVVAARCDSSPNSKFHLTLFVESPSTLTDGDDAPVHITFDRQPAAERVGKMFSTGEGGMGVELQLQAADDIWDALKVAQSVTFGLAGAQATTVPGTADAAASFVDKCAGLASQAQN